MTIKLKGSSDGSVSLSAPADTSPSGSDITLTLPTDAGSANQFIKNSGTAGTLDYSSMVEDSSGRVGLGGTPDAWDTDSGLQAIQLHGYGALWNYYNNVQLAFNTYQASGGDKYLTTDEASKYTLDGAGNHIWYTAVSGSADAAITFSERMRIDNSGNVGIGTSSPSSILHLDAGTGDTRLNIEGGTNGDGILALAGAGSGTSKISFWDQLAIGKTSGGVGDIASEYLRIDSSGNVAINSTSAIGNGKLSLLFHGASTNGLVIHNSWSGNDASYVVFRNYQGTTVGQISANQTTTTYSTSSDYRLKENVVDLDGAISRVKQLAPKRFNFIADADRTVDGFLAHEAQTVVPEAVTGEKDGEEMQGIDQAKLVPLLTAALKEAITKIETLETKVAALEAA